MGVRTGVTHDTRSGDDGEVSSFDSTLSPSTWAKHNDGSGSKDDIGWDG